MIDVVNRSFFIEAERRLAEDAVARGEAGVFSPLAILQAYADIRSPTGRQAPVETFHPLSLGELIQDFVGDVGHVCDSAGLSYAPIAAGAMGVDLDDLVFLDSETDETLKLLPPSHLTRPDPPFHGVVNVNRAGFALRGLAVLMPPGDVAHSSRNGLQQVLRFAEECGMDAERLFLLGLGAWAAERTDPEATQNHDVQILRGHGPRL